MQSRRFANPWWLMAGAAAGGLAWAVGLPVWAAAVIGVIIWLTTILVFGFLFASPDPLVPVPDTGCAERARSAAAAFRELAAPLSAEPPVDRMLWRVDEIAASISHLSRRSDELASLSHTLSGDPREHEYAQYVQGRYDEVRHRTQAATSDLENTVARFEGILSARHLSAGGGALDELAAALETIGYGVDIGERIVDDVLGPEPSPGPPVP
ncbi:hypothetical protein [Actinorugispora endophytica]|uniref:5-bromo-4-chloroindolyl phosphate hydrolysis protein n=1 Tax=Actinorugispora endophytica TaxID=1605990 RepID=A0A4R6UM61_9ACTN|nr:hypothetical protein [Actinorugispora endophytica]TDQ48001.1 hypothetical protein EV190_12060 [Actinorugispora endophytica]